MPASRPACGVTTDRHTALGFLLALIRMHTVDWEEEWEEKGNAEVRQVHFLLRLDELGERSLGRERSVCIVLWACMLVCVHLHLNCVHPR